MMRIKMVIGIVAAGAAIAAPFVGVSPSSAGPAGCLQYGIGQSCIYYDHGKMIGQFTNNRGGANTVQIIVSNSYGQSKTCKWVRVPYPETTICPWDSSITGALYFAQVISKAGANNVSPVVTSP
jgi:hypothetical protein